METGFVTVVVPIYKTEKYLDRCISSIVHQTYPNLEILLIDDGSPDHCPQICDAWAQKDSRIHVIHKNNAGSGMARNTGIENATGEYICFFDSDDYLAPETIEKAYKHIQESQTDIVVFGMDAVDSHEKITKQIIPESATKCFCGNDVQTVFLPDLIDCAHNEASVKGLCLSACVCMFSMALIRKAEWRFVSEREIMSEDSYSLIQLYKHVKSVAILPEALYFYRLNEASQSHTYKEERYQLIKHCYHECLKLADRLAYCQEVHRSISGLCLSLSIAAMKQIASGKMKYKEKRKLLAQIIDDESMRRCLADTACRQYGRARRILFWAMEHRLYFMVYLFAKAQSMRRK